MIASHRRLLARRCPDVPHRVVGSDAPLRSGRRADVIRQCPNRCVGPRRDRQLDRRGGTNERGVGWCADGEVGCKQDGDETSDAEPDSSIDHRCRTWNTHRCRCRPPASAPDVRSDFPDESQGELRPHDPDAGSEVDGSFSWIAVRTFVQFGGVCGSGHPAIRTSINGPDDKDGEHEYGDQG